MPRAVAGNLMLRSRTDQLRDDLVADSFLHLFKNDFTPTPATAVGGFTEADFAGYAAVDLHTTYSARFLVRDGLYQFNSGTARFDCTAGTQIIYGWYLLYAGDTRVAFARRFDTPFTISLANPLALIIKPFVAARSLYPCEAE